MKGFSFFLLCVCVYGGLKPKVNFARLYLLLLIPKVNQVSKLIIVLRSQHKKKCWTAFSSFTFLLCKYLQSRQMDSPWNIWIRCLYLFSNCYYKEIPYILSSIQACLFSWQCGKQWNAFLLFQCLNLLQVKFSFAATHVRSCNHKWLMAYLYHDYLYF